MAYFLPSFFQKRILRYALSRLELLETDDLGLDKLEIAWGRRSTVELRDIGVNIKKLSTLLKLPACLVLSRARVSLLRLTVPADLYQSGIVVELEGIEVKLETNYAKKESTADLEQRSREPGSKRYRTITADRSRSTQSLVHDPGGPPASVSSNIHNQEEDEPLEELSFTVDLAQSFLQEEPQAEKEELKAAIVKSRQPDQSPTPSDTEDDETAFGVGNALSLPSFLADFLKGVGDRIQLKVKKAMVDLDLKLELSADRKSVV